MNNDPDWVSNGKQAARKGFPRRSEDQKSTSVIISISVRGERANFTRLVLGCIEAKVCK